MAKHNERRRNNRAIKKNVIAWARREGHNDSELARLEKAPPRVAKDWARDRGADPDKFVDGVPDQSIPGQPAVEDQAAGPQVPHLGLGSDAPAGNGLPRAPVHQPRPPAVAGGGGGGRGGGSGAGGVSAGGVNTPSEPRPPAWSTHSWCTPELRDQIQVAMRQQGVHRDERALLDGAVEHITTLKRAGAATGYSSAEGSGPTGGTNTTRRVELANGVTGYFKPFDGVRDDLATAFGQDSSQQSLHEAAAWQLAREMGPPWSEVVPPVVIREINGELGSFAMARPGKEMVRAPWHTGEWRQSAFFDSLIGQQDRHPGNYLVSGDRIALIDHGYTFAEPGNYKNYSWLVEQRAATDPALSYDERQVLQRLTTSPNLWGLESMLQPDRAAALRERANRMLASGHLTTDY